MNKEVLNFNLKNKKAVSLIVLIITIAVMISLAAAVIVSMNSTKPIENAEKAVDATNESSLVEAANTANTQYALDLRLGNITTETSRVEYVKNELQKQGFDQTLIDKVNIDESTGQVLLDEVSAVFVANDPQKYYGASVTNYTATKASVVGWKILYSNGTNIYLIADDYIPYSSIPYSTKDGVATGNKPNQGSSTYPYAAYFDNILGDYEGSASITSTTLRKLNSKYYAYLSSNSKTSTNGDMKAVAYMMDTIAWSGFAGKNADYAIGGPTIEIMVNSYNQKYTDTSRKLDLIVEDGAGSPSNLAIDGYTAKQGTESWENHISYAFAKSVSGTGNTATATYDSLYSISDTSNATGMWVASPSAADYYANHLMRVDYNANLSFYYSGYDTLGFRPLVCLKSNVTLKEVENGFEIQ